MITAHLQILEVLKYLASYSPITKPLISVNVVLSSLVAMSSCNAHLEIATSDDNSTFTDFRGFVIGEYEARYFKFRVVLISRDNASTPVVSEVTVTIDMIDRIFSGNDIVSGTGTKSITFTNPFKTSNYAVGVTGQGMATGDYFTVSNKSINGFDVAFFNSSNTGVSKTFDFIAKGF